MRKFEIMNAENITELFNLRLQASAQTEDQKQLMGRSRKSLMIWLE